MFLADGLGLGWRVWLLSTLCVLLSQIHYSNPVSSTKPLIVHITSHDRLVLSTHHGSGAKIAPVDGQEVFEWKCVCGWAEWRSMCLWRLEIMAGEDNWTAFTLDVSHSEALQWVHNCCHPGMLRVLEDKRVTAVIVLDAAVCAENTINPVHLASFLWPTGGLCEWGSLHPWITLQRRPQLFMDISHIALDELAGFQRSPQETSCRFIHFIFQLHWNMS